MHINVEQQTIPFDYIEACREERELMMTTALAWKAAVVAQDTSPLVEKSYAEDESRSVRVRFLDDTKLLLELKTLGGENETSSYQYDTASQRLSYNGELLSDGEQQYSTFVRVHKALYTACDEERQHANSQG